MIIIRYRRPFVDWLNSDTDADTQFTLEEINDDCSTALIPEYDSEEQLETIIKQVYPNLFELELSGWIRDEEVWPENRTFEIFKEWFEIQSHSMVLDLVIDEIEKERHTY